VRRADTRLMVVANDVSSRVAHEPDVVTTFNHRLKVCSSCFRCLLMVAWDQRETWTSRSCLELRPPDSAGVESVHEHHVLGSVLAAVHSLFERPAVGRPHASAVAVLVQC